jgi:hypothetical protein
VITEEPIPPDANILVSPAEPSPGALGAFAKYAKLEQIRRLELERQLRVWEVNAVISDHVPLAGDAAAALSRDSYHLLYLNENPLWIYLHSGGRNAVYYGLFGDGEGKLKHIAVKVESRLPSNALVDLTTGRRGSHFRAPGAGTPRRKAWPPWGHNASGSLCSIRCSV